MSNSDNDEVIIAKGNLAFAGAGLPEEFVMRGNCLCPPVVNKLRTQIALLCAKEDGFVYQLEWTITKTKL